jgi:hypothetical protein
MIARLPDFAGAKPCLMLCGIGWREVLFHRPRRARGDEEIVELLSVKHGRNPFLPAQHCSLIC